MASCNAVHVMHACHDGLTPLVLLLLLASAAACFCCCSAQVTSDSRYTYYRIKVSLVNKFEDFFYPVPGKPTLISAVISGDVIDNTTSIKVRSAQRSSAFRDLLSPVFALRSPFRRWPFRLCQSMRMRSEGCIATRA
jgi:hypothetical protein